MTSTSSKVVVIDDEIDHLAGLTDSLTAGGIDCLPVHYTGNVAKIRPCPSVRVVIADLHLGSGTLTADPRTDFSVIGTLLDDRIRPAGVYIILLWTLYENHATALQGFLERLQRAAKPVAVLPLPKTDHLDSAGKVRSRDKLMQHIHALAEDWLRPRGVLGLQGAWHPIEDQEVDALIEDIYASRRTDTGRPAWMED